MLVAIAALLMPTAACVALYVPFRLGWGRQLSKLAAAVLLVPTSACVSLYGLVRLGWGRHGASEADLGFLHLDWVGDPSLSQWRAHVENLGCLVVGIAFLITSVILAAFWLLTRLGTNAARTR